MGHCPLYKEHESNSVSCSQDTLRKPTNRCSEESMIDSSMETRLADTEVDASLDIHTAARSDIPSLRLHGWKQHLKWQFTSYRG